MADNEINYLAKKYCALCFEPLDNDFDGTCGACGQKTTALNVLKRLKFDSSVDKKSRTAPKFAALLSTLAFAVQLVYAVIVLLFSLNVFPENHTSVEDHTSVSLPDLFENLTDEERKEREIYSFYFDKAMKCDDYWEFLEECKPLKYEPDYYRGIWNNAGISRYISENQSKIPQDPLPEAKKEENAVPKALGTGFSIMFIVLSLCGLAACVAVFLEFDGSVKALLFCSGEFSKLFVLTFNFFSVALMFFSVFQLSFLNEQLGGGRLRYSRLWKIYKAKNPIGSADEWCCKNCGYINSKLDSECKSCGKYK